MNQKTKYGTITQTGIMTSRTQRKEIYTSDETGKKFVESCFVVDYHDHSPRVINDPEDPNYRRYNEKCSSCWLGFAHSTDKHDSEVKEG